MQRLLEMKNRQCLMPQGIDVERKLLACSVTKVTLLNWLAQSCRDVSFRLSRGCWLGRARSPAGEGRDVLPALQLQPAWHDPSSHPYAVKQIGSFSRRDISRGLNGKTCYPQ